MARDTEDLSEIHLAIATILEEKQIKQVTLAERLGVTQAQISRWTNPKEQGHGPTLYKLPHIEDACEVWRGEIIRRAGPNWFDFPMSTTDVIRQDGKLSLAARERVANVYLLELEKATGAKPSKGRSAKISDAAS